MSHYLSACLIFKDEAAYLSEWLHFYRHVGVDHFYLYDNGSSDNFSEIILPWIGKGLVSYYRAEGPALQLPVYRHCLATSAKENQWIMFVDADEFLFSPDMIDLRNFLSGFESEAGVVANWACFGTSGHQTKPEQLVTQSYTHRCELNFERACNHVKTIVNCGAVQDVSWSPHHFIYKDGRVPVNALREAVPGPFSDNVVMEGLRINHYLTKSLDEYRRKILRGRADTVQLRNLEEDLQKAECFNVVSDTTILPLAQQVAERMASGLIL